ncbi:hypothetical protein D3C78_1065490 [compost metagenome]
MKYPRIFSQRQRHARIVPGLGAEQTGNIGDRAAHRSFGGQLLDEHLRSGPERHTPLGRTQSIDVVERRRIAQRPHHVAAVGHRQHAQRQRHRRPAAAAAGNQGRIVGVGGGAEHAVVGLRAEAEFRDVALADDDRPAVAHPRHADDVVLRNLLGEQR